MSAVCSVMIYDLVVGKCIRKELWMNELRSFYHLNSIAEDPVKVGCEETEKEVEMNLVAETPHLSEKSWLSVKMGIMNEIFYICISNDYSIT